MLPPRRARFNVRTVKAGISRYHTWNRRADDNRPLTSTDITAVEVTVHQPPPGPDKKLQFTAPTQRHASPRSAGQARRTGPSGGRWQIVQAILQQTPGRPRRAEDIAAALGITGKQSLHSFYVQMSAWARRGWLTKAAPGIYRITLPPAIDTAP